MNIVEPDQQAAKKELRRRHAEERSIDAARVRDEIVAAKIARDAKTVRLRALRLAKEAAEHEAAAAIPIKPKGRRRKAAAR